MEETVDRTHRRSKHPRVPPQHQERPKEPRSAGSVAVWLVASVPLGALLALFVVSVGAPAYYAWRQVQKLEAPIKVLEGKREEALRGGKAAPAPKSEAEFPGPEEVSGEAAE
jgi:hypothetical protein